MQIWAVFDFYGPLKASFNNDFTLKNLSYMYMSLHAISVFDKV